MSELTSPRVLIRQMERWDQDEFLDLVRASKALHDRWIYPPSTPEEFTAHVARLDGGTAAGFVVCLRATGAIVGYVGIRDIVHSSYQRGVLGFGAFVPYARCGYMAEGLGLVIRHAFGPMGLHRLEADIEPANQASRRLVQRLGFRLEGFSPAFIKVQGAWRDFERWAIIAPNDRPDRV